MNGTDHNQVFCTTRKITEEHGDKSQNKRVAQNKGLLTRVRLTPWTVVHGTASETYVLWVGKISLYKDNRVLNKICNAADWKHFAMCAYGGGLRAKKRRSLHSPIIL